MPKSSVPSERCAPTDDSERDTSTGILFVVGAKRSANLSNQIDIATSLACLGHRLTPFCSARNRLPEPADGPVPV